MGSQSPGPGNFRHGDNEQSRSRRTGGDCHRGARGKGNWETTFSCFGFGLRGETWEGHTGGRARRGKGGRKSPTASGRAKRGQSGKPTTAKQLSGYDGIREKGGVPAKMRSHSRKANCNWDFGLNIPRIKLRGPRTPVLGGFPGAGGTKANGKPDYLGSKSHGEHAARSKDSCSTICQ